MPNDLSGAELDARFFEVCWGWRKKPVHDPDVPDSWIWQAPDGSYPVGSDAVRQYYDSDAVSTDANACEAWAMRWAREQGLVAMVEEMLDGRWCASLAQFDGDGEFVDSHDSKGQDWKEAFVRACVAAGQALKTNGEPKHD